MPQSLHRLQRDAPHLALPSTISTQSNTPIPRLTPLSTPNAIQIQSAVFLQFTHLTDRQTDKPTDGIGNKSVRIPAYRLRSTALIDSEYAAVCNINASHFCCVCTDHSGGSVQGVCMYHVTPTRLTSLADRCCSWERLLFLSSNFLYLRLHVYSVNGGILFYWTRCHQCR